jgi:cytochrome c oxidase assembly protein subunit 15
MSAQAWQAEFTRYQAIPQYRELNKGMSLGEFKTIYWWEWTHRLLARGVGIAYLLPFLFFLWRGWVPPGQKLRLWGIFALGGLQGAVGWWMVASGLTERVEVSQYRLATHLMLALLALGGLQGAVGWWMVSSGLTHDVKVSHFRLAAHLLVALVTLGGLVWTALDLRANARGEPPARLPRFGMAVLGMLLVQLFFGALTAGLRAGHVASDWPLMQGSLFPEGIDWSAGPIHALLYDPFLIHFIHRWWAWVVVAALVVLGRKLKARGQRRASIAVHSAFGTQVILGVFTVWSGIALWLAVAHQLVGALLVAATTWGAHALGRRAE